MTHGQTDKKIQALDFDGWACKCLDFGLGLVNIGRLPFNFKPLHHTCYVACIPAGVKVNSLKFCDFSEFIVKARSYAKKETFFRE